jgi:hypothetical protein
MTVRTSQRTVTFARTFSLNGLDEAHPAGTYTVQTHEESIPGLSFLAWRRVAILIFLPSRPGGAFVEQLVEVDPLDLEAAQESGRLVPGRPRLGTPGVPRPKPRFPGPQPVKSPNSSAAC